jgi:subfamily B ATP-binding cassette protein MsbA
MPSIKSIPLLKRCLRYFIPYKLLVAGSLVALLFVAACTAGSAYLVQPALDEIFINKDRAALATLPIILVLVFLVKGVAAFFQRFLMSYCGLKVLEELRNELFGKIICLPVDFFSENRVGMLMSRIISDVNLISTSLPTLINMCRHALTMVGLIGLVIYRDPFLSLLAMLVFPLAIYPVIFFGKKLRKIGRKSQGKIADISALLQESFSGLRVVKAFAMEGKEREKFAVQNGKWVRLTIRGKVYNQMSSPIMEIIGAIGAGLVIWYGGSRVIAGESTPGTFFSFLTAMIMLYEPFKSISSANMSIQNALAGAERVFEILDDPKIRIESSGSTIFEPPFSTLELKKVSFTYPDNATPALSDISFKVRAGEKIALVGSSGAGKSTLVSRAQYR